MNIEKIHTHIDSEEEENLKILKMLVALPSVSATGEGVRDCAANLVALLREIGFDANIYETGGQPAVFGEIKSNIKNAKTILFYGHYDVQPPEPYDAWLSEPFEADVRDGRVYGRGAADNKGQFLCHILAVKSILAADKGLPLNIKIILDGEEESGSPNLASFVISRKKMLSANVCICSDGPMYDDVTPSVSLGNRGVLSFDIEIETAKADNHSGNKGGVIPNAAWEMVRLLGTILNEDGSVAIEGFYDDVEPVDDEKMALIDAIPYDAEQTAELFGVESIPYTKRDFYSRLMYLPTFTINGFNCGYSGENSKTIIPAKAIAKCDVRLAANQDGEKIFALIQRHLDTFNPSAKLIFGSLMQPSVSDPSEPVVQAAIEAAKKTYGVKPVVIPVMGGSLPAYVWTKLLSMPAISVPYANPDESNHAPNENMGLWQFYKGIHNSAQIIREISLLSP